MAEREIDRRIQRGLERVTGKWWLYVLLLRLFSCLRTYPPDIAPWTRWS
jgi:hypothetical protein